MSDVPRVDMCDEVVETSLSLVEKIVAAKGGQPFTLHFYGGEPFAAFERMQSIVVRARDRKINCRYGIVTNGCTATPEQVLVRTKRPHGGAEHRRLRRGNGVQPSGRNPQV